MKQYLTLGAAALAAACVMQPEPGSPEAGALAFAQDCAACHGADGRGAGPATPDIGRTPPDLTTLAARNGGEFPQLYVLAIIDGLERDQHFSDVMPEFGAGDMGGTIVVELEEGIGTPVPSRLLALVAYLETIQVTP